MKKIDIVWNVTYFRDVEFQLKSSKNSENINNMFLIFDKPKQSINLEKVFASTSIKPHIIYKKELQQEMIIPQQHVNSDYVIRLYSHVPDIDRVIEQAISTIEDKDAHVARFVSSSIYKTSLFKIIPFHEFSLVSDAENNFYSLEEEFVVNRLRLKIVDKHGTIIEAKQPLKKKTLASPIVIVAYGGRSGSTWLQRVLNSHQDICVWGEPRLSIPAFNSFIINIKKNRLNTFVSLAIKAYREAKSKDDVFIATLPPDFNNNLFEEYKHIVTSYFHRTNHKYWGFKTVALHPSYLAFLLTLFPDACFIGIKRDKKNQMLSMLKRKDWWNDIEAAYNDWAKNFDGLDIFMKFAREAGNVAPVFRYEELDPDKLCKLLEQQLQQPEGSFSRDISSKRIIDFKHSEELRRNKDV